MCTARRINNRGGFTLLEIMLAVAILALVSMSIYRFVITTVDAVRISTEQVREKALMEAFAAYLRDRMQRLPKDRAGAVMGEAHRFNSVSSDELRWVSGPGPGLLTRSAEGEWYVTLTIQRMKGGKDYELGVRRQDVEAHSDAGWLPLLPNVYALEVRYFDRRAAAWMEKWTDSTVRPALVRVKIWRQTASDPYEVVLPIPTSLPTGTGMQNPGMQNPGGVPGVPLVPGINPGGTVGPDGNPLPGVNVNPGGGGGSRIRRPLGK